MNHVKKQTAFTAVALFSALTLGTMTPCRAEPIPIQEEFVLVQSTFVDTSLDAVLLFLSEENGFLDDSAVIKYQSSFTISLDANGVPSGTFSGIYGGFYDGLPVTGTDTGDLTMIGTDLVFTGPSKIKIDDKDYTNNLTFTEKNDNKGSLEGGVKDGAGNEKSISAPDLDKEKANGKLKLKGNATIGGHNETLTFTLDQKTGKFDSTIKSGIFINKKNDGDYGPLKDLLPGESQEYKMNLTFFQSVSVPEPPSVVMLGIGALGLLGYASRRRKEKRGT